MKMISGNQIVIAGERFRVGDVVTTSEKGIPLVSAWVLPFHDITPSFNHRFILSARDSILIHGGPNAGSGFRQRSMRFTDRMRIGWQKRTRTRSGRAGSAGSMRNSTWPGTRICADRIPDLRLAYLIILVLYSISLSLICCWPAKFGPYCALSLVFHV